MSIDGPKAVGKSTILDYIKRSWNTHLDLTVLTEKRVNPNQEIVANLLRPGVLDVTVDRAVAEAFAKGRAAITRCHLETSRSEVIIIDRWYPSDAAFRRYVPFEECAELNMQLGVWAPDLVIAMSCHPNISWKRANSRPKGLSSLVIHNLHDHRESTQRFDEVAHRMGWQVVDTSAPQETVCEVVKKILLTYFESGDRRW